MAINHLKLFTLASYVSATPPAFLHSNPPPFRDSAGFSEGSAARLASGKEVPPRLLCCSRTTGEDWSSSEEPQHTFLRIILTAQPKESYIFATFPAIMSHNV